jgi:hypothetical protein
MLMRRPAVRTLWGWAISVLQEAGAIRECDEHGWMRGRADPHALERALTIARDDPPTGVAPDQRLPKFTMCSIRSVTPAQSAHGSLSKWRYIYPISSRGLKAPT